MDYNKPLFEAKELVKLYKELADEIFPLCSVDNCCSNIKRMPNGCCEGMKEIVWKIGTCCGCCACFKNFGGCCGPKYSNEPLRKKLTEYFGTRKLKDVLIPVQIVSFKINRNGGPIYFTDFDNPEISMVDAALASSAAPTFFPTTSFQDPEHPIIHHCIDGGVYENNPVFAALGYAITRDRERTNSLQNRSVQDFYVLSIGTGSTQLTKSPLVFERYGLIGWAPHVVDLGIFGTSAVADRNMLRILSNKNYKRIQANFDSAFKEMDDPDVIDPLIEEVFSSTTNTAKSIKEFAENYRIISIIEQNAIAEISAEELVRIARESQILREPIGRSASRFRVPPTGSPIS